VAWAGLAALLRWALGASVEARRGFWVSWSIAFGYGLAIEALQAPIATRSAEVLDLLADALGALLGAWLVGRRYP
jgi:VanZ family protein